MSEDVMVRQDGNVLVIALSRPEKRNALTASMYAQLAQSFQDAEVSTSVHSILLRGNGGVFTSGNDIGLFLDQDAEEPHEPAAASFIRAVIALSKPLVACVRGHAVGIGVTVLLHCDYVVASDDARLRFPFVDLGLCPEFASTLVLERIVGRNKAAEWMLLGAPIPAGEARSAGLVNQVMPAELAEEEALSVARRLASKPQMALRATRALLRHGGDDSLAERIDRESEVFDTLRRTPEAQQIFRLFLDRTPQAMPAHI